MRAESGKGKGAGSVLRYFESHRAPIVGALESLAARRSGGEGLGRIVEFCRRGKMIRGCLVFLGAEAAIGPAAASHGDLLAAVAAAMELFQAGLLVHDDIMDRDDTRRGEPALHARYAADALAAGTVEYLHIGEALGICAGDICYFEGFAMLARSLAGHERAGDILSRCAEGLSEVAFAQMTDVRWGGWNEEPDEEAILSMYRGKTARYSFSLPMAVGALSAGGSDLVGPLTELGESLGILFQIRDDELGLFGSEERTGKPVGSDLREGKKTLFRARLLAAAPLEKLPWLKSLFDGSVPAGKEDIERIRDLAEDLGVAPSIEKMSTLAEEKATDLVGTMSGLEPETAAVLLDLIEYVRRRER